MAHFHAVIMAGGSGTRFWPRSRNERPKQLLSLFSDKPLIRETVERLLPLFPPERISLVTTASQADAVAEASGLPRDRVVVEPEGRDTAACIGLAAVLLEKRDPGAVFCVLPADHYIGDVDAFRELLRKGEARAREGKIVTFGVTPTRPETGYGYIQTDGERLLRFAEKPDLETARSFLAEGNYCWNSGIFIWQAADILDAIATHLPEHGVLLKRIAEAVDTPEFEPVLAEAYPRFGKISIDYGVMERIGEAVVLQAGFGWDDVGSWPAAAKYRQTDDAGNVTEGRVVLEGTSGSIVLSGDPDHLMAVLDGKDLVVIHEQDATLVCPHSSAADLKRLVEAIRKAGAGAWLERTAE